MRGGVLAILAYLAVSACSMASSSLAPPFLSTPESKPQDCSGLPRPPSTIIELLQAARLTITPSAISNEDYAQEGYLKCLFNAKTVKSFRVEATSLLTLLDIMADSITREYPQNYEIRIQLIPFEKSVVRRTDIYFSPKTAPPFQVVPPVFGETWKEVKYGPPIPVAARLSSNISSNVKNVDVKYELNSSSFAVFKINENSLVESIYLEAKID